MQHVRYDVDGWGVGELWARDTVLLASEAPVPGRDAHVLLQPRRPLANSLRGCNADEHPLAWRFQDWFRGSRDDFRDVPLELAWATPFQRALVEALRGIPSGEVVTYGELAALAGRPGAARAAGAFCAGNRFFLVVPCHRVVGASGLGGYGSLGLDYKRRLLRMEGYAS